MGECFFWYRPTRVVPDQRPLNGRCCCCCSGDFFNILDALPKQVLIATDSMTLHMDSQQFQSIPCPHTHTHTHPFNGPLSRTIRVSRYQKGKPIWILLKQETVSGSGISCTSLQTDNHASTQALRFYRPDALPAAQPTASKH